MTRCRLVLVTTNHPYTHTGGETMFVEPELRQLAAAFSTVCVAPQHAHGPRLELPGEVALDTSLASRLRRHRWRRYAAALCWPGFWSELARAARRGGWVGCARVWRWAATAGVTYQWARTSFASGEPVLFYTYWRGGSTLGLARLAAHRPRTAVVTRVHGYDLYEDRFHPPFQPWHPALYDQLASTIAVSRHGSDYLLGAGVQQDRLELSRLGTAAAPVPAASSGDGVLRIVSCSTMTAVKRVPLIARSLVHLALNCPDNRIHWTHFGDGPERSAVRRALSVAPPNFSFELPGQVDHARVLAHYGSQPVDAFVLLSASEGLPVSIQEAAAAGVPIVATDVGGVRELVGSDNGALLSANPDIAEVSSAILRAFVASDAASRAGMRSASRRRWSADFDADANHSQLAGRLLALASKL